MCRLLLLNFLLFNVFLCSAQTLIQKADGTAPILTNGLTVGVDITRPSASIYYLKPKVDTIATKKYRIRTGGGTLVQLDTTVDVPIIGERLLGLYGAVTNEDEKASTFAVFGKGKIKPNVRIGFLIGGSRDLKEEVSTRIVVESSVYSGLIRRLKEQIQLAMNDSVNNKQSIKRDLDLMRLLQKKRRDLLNSIPNRPLITRTWYVSANVSTSSFNYLNSPNLSKFTTSLVEDSLAIAFDGTAGLNYHIGRDWLIGGSIGLGRTNNLATLESKTYSRKDFFKNDSLSVETSKTYNAVTGNYRQYWQVPVRLDLLKNIPLSRTDSVASLLVYAGIEYNYPTNINIQKVLADQVNLLAGLYLFTGRKQRFIGGLQFGFQDVGNKKYWLKQQTDAQTERPSFGDRFTISIVGRITLARLGGLQDYFTGLRSN